MIGVVTTSTGGGTGPRGIGPKYFVSSAFNWLRVPRYALASEVVCPPIYLTGYLEFQDALGKNLSEAYVGQLPAKDAMNAAQDQAIAALRRAGTKL